MIGAEARWSVELVVDGRPSASVEYDRDALTVESLGGAVDLRRASTPGAFDVVLAHAGVGRVRFTLGSFTTAIDVRVASADEVVGIEVHRGRLDPPELEGDALVAIEPASARERVENADAGIRRTFASVLVLRDGTRAFGGAGFFGFSNPDVPVSTHRHDGGTVSSGRGWPDALGAAFFDLWIVDGETWPADAAPVLEARVGNATGAWAVLPPSRTR